MSEEFKDNSEMNNPSEKEVQESGVVNFTMSDPPVNPEESGDSNQEPGKVPTEENPVYASSRKEEEKEEWYEKEREAHYGAYQYGSPIPPEKKQDKKKRNHGAHGMARKLGTAAAVAAVFGLVSGVVFQFTGYVGEQLNPREKVQIQNTQTTGQGTSDQDAISTSGSSASGATVSEVARNAMPSVVSILGVSIQEMPQIYQYFGYGSEQETKSSGSGIIVGQNDTELLIATNNHVVSGTDSLSVFFTDQNGSAATSTQDLEKTSIKGVKEGENSYSTESGSAVAAQIKGTDADNDLAVIAVKLADIPEDILTEIKVARIGDSEALQMGDQVVAIGNALGYGQSVTSGYVSAKDRIVNSDNVNSTFIQTDAAINPGNSGGALLNMKGELVGINSAKIASQEVEGVGFAIPISRAEPILDEMMSKETREKVQDEDEAAYIGITCKDVTTEVNQMYGMPIGVYVDSFTENSPAEAGGVKKGDIILKIDGSSVSAYTELVDKLQYYKAGEKVEFVIARSEDGEYKEHTVTITLGAKKDAPVSGNSGQSKQSRQNFGQ